jgi:hypothetical protein
MLYIRSKQPGRGNMLIFRKEPKGDVYVQLIDLATTICSEFILVNRHQMNIGEKGNLVIQELTPYLKEIKEQDSWPGTQLLEHTATVHYYYLNNDSNKVLKKYVTSLYSWQQPDFPEDLCFLKAQGKPWLISISHEGFSYIQNTNAVELEKLKLIKGIDLADE